MELYAAIDLHSNNGMLVVLDKDDHVILERRLPNDLERIRLALAPHRESIRGIAVESTYNWYWLVDGLMHDGYPLHLVNTAAVKQYEGLKYSSDQHDARWLAHLASAWGFCPRAISIPGKHAPCATCCASVVNWYVAAPRKFSASRTCSHATWATKSAATPSRPGRRTRSMNWRSCRNSASR